MGPLTLTVPLLAFSVTDTWPTCNHLTSRRTSIWMLSILMFTAKEPTQLQLISVNWNEAWVHQSVFQPCFHLIVASQKQCEETEIWLKMISMVEAVVAGFAEKRNWEEPKKTAEAKGQNWTRGCGKRHFSLTLSSSLQAAVYSNSHIYYRRSWREKENTSFWLKPQREELRMN